MKKGILFTDPFSFLPLPTDFGLTQIKKQSKTKGKAGSRILFLFFYFLFFFLSGFFLLFSSCSLRSFYLLYFLFSFPLFVSLRFVCLCFCLNSSLVLSHLHVPWDASRPGLWWEVWCVLLRYRTLGAAHTGMWKYLSNICFCLLNIWNALYLSCSFFLFVFVYFHRTSHTKDNSPILKNWWMQLPRKERDQMFPLIAPQNWNRFVFFVGCVDFSLTALFFPHCFLLLFFGFCLFVVFFYFRHLAQFVYLLYVIFSSFKVAGTLHRPTVPHSNKSSSHTYSMRLLWMVCMREEKKKEIEKQKEKRTG